MQRISPSYTNREGRPTKWPIDSAIAARLMSCWCLHCLAVWARDEVGAEAGDGAPADDDSDFSDLELEDIAAVKLRARTPPWQKVENSQW